MRLGDVFLYLPAALLLLWAKGLYSETGYSANIMKSSLMGCLRASDVNITVCWIQWGLHRRSSHCLVTRLWWIYLLIGASSSGWMHCVPSHVSLVKAAPETLVFCRHWLCQVIQNGFFPVWSRKSCTSSFVEVADCLLIQCVLLCFRNKHFGAATWLESLLYWSVRRMLDWT